MTNEQESILEGVVSRMNLSTVNEWGKYSFYFESEDLQRYINSKSRIPLFTQGVVEPVDPLLYEDYRLKAKVVVQKRYSKIYSTEYYVPKAIVIIEKLALDYGNGYAENPLM